MLPLVRVWSVKARTVEVTLELRIESIQASAYKCSNRTSHFRVRVFDRVGVAERSSSRGMSFGSFLVEFVEDDARLESHTSLRLRRHQKMTRSRNSRSNPLKKLSTRDE